MKIVSKILIWLAVILIVLVLGRNVIAKAGAEAGTQLAIGFPLHIGSLDIGLQKTHVWVKDLHLSNPGGFDYKTMLQMPEIYVAYDLPELSKGKIHLPELRVNVQEFAVIKNKDGKVNLDLLKPAKKERRKAEAPKSGEMPKFQIDRIDFKVGKVLYKDYSKGKEPQVKEFNINLNEHYERITSMEAVISLMVVKMLAKTSIAALANIDLNDLKGVADDALDMSKKLASQAAVEAQKTVSEATRETEKIVGTGGETAKKTTKVLKDTAKELTNSLAEKLKNPFEKKE